MSHFTTGVVIPTETPNTIAASEDSVSLMLAPFDENCNSYPPYQEKCECWYYREAPSGRGVYQEVADRVESVMLAETAVGTVERMRQVFGERDDVRELRRRLDAAASGEDAMVIHGQVQAVWNELTRPWFDRRTVVESEAKQHHPLYLHPNPGCEECGGTGAYESRYNPFSQWDWWVIGGRWGKVLTGSGNRCRIQDLPSVDDKRFFALVVPRQVTLDEDGLVVGMTSAPSGRREVADVPSAIRFLSSFAHEIYGRDGLWLPEWHSKGTMGWWAVVRDEKDADDWRVQEAELLSAYSGWDVILCDLHI